MDYFIPANDKGINLAQTFIIDGYGYDLYPRSWNRIESMANLDDNNITCLGFAKVLYARSEDDRNRFIQMQQKLKENLNNYDFMFKKALEKLNVAMELYQTMMFEENVGKVRMAAGYIADFLSCAVAFANQTYFKYSQIEQMAELSKIESVPENFISYYENIINANTIDQLKKLSYEIIFTTRKFLNQRKPKRADEKLDVDFNNLADWYQELNYTWRRIDYWGNAKNAQKVFVWGCLLQGELNAIKEEFKLEDMDILGCYNSKDLSDFLKKTSETERYIISQIKNHGITLNSYSSVDEFIAKNS